MIIREVCTNFGRGKRRGGVRVSEWSKDGAGVVGGVGANFFSSKLYFEFG